MRIYAVTDKSNNTSRLVVADNPAQAMRHVANDMFDVKAASSIQVAALMTSGVQVEHAKAAEQESAPAEA